MKGLFPLGSLPGLVVIAMVTGSAGAQTNTRPALEEVIVTAQNGNSPSTI